MTFGNKTQADFSFSRAYDDAGYAYPQHWHDCFEILWVRSGTFAVATSGADIMLECNDVVILPPCALHGTYANTAEYEVCILGYTDALIYNSDISFDNKKYLTPFRINPIPRIIRSDHPASLEIRTCLAEVMRCYESRNAVRELRVRAAILALHAGLYAAVLGELAQEEAAGRYILEAECFIESRITENISPYEIADALHISYSHFARLIHEHYGCSAGELITRMKISYAEQLMNANVWLSVSDIAAAVGYSSASYFARRFRQLRGCSPNEFRKLITAGKNAHSDTVEV